MGLNNFSGKKKKNAILGVMLNLALAYSNVSWEQSDQWLPECIEPLSH